MNIIAVWYGFLLLSGKKLLATGSAKRDLYAKPTASRKAAQLWVGKDVRGGSPKGDLCHWLSTGCISPASRNIILSYSYTHGCAVQLSKRAQICKCFGAFLRQPAAEIRPAQCLAET